MLCRALKLLRTLNDTSQQELARELGISSSYLSQIESGARKPTLDLIESYSRIFKIPGSTIMMFAETLGSNGVRNESRAYVVDTILRAMELLGGDVDNDSTEPSTKDRPQKVLR